MEKVWQLIATAPAHVELELSIYDKANIMRWYFPVSAMVRVARYSHQSFHAA